MTDFQPELLALLRDHLTVGSKIETLSQHKPNWIAAISGAGVTIETERTRAMGEGPQFVPAWMFQEAWDRLTSRGFLTNRELLATKDLNVKRSSAVCAVLATLPGVSVSSGSPIVLRWEH